MKQGFEKLAIELVERIASFLQPRDLKTFRTLDSKCASAGFKPLLAFMPSAVNSSNLNRRDLGPKRRLSQLVDATSALAISKIIYSLTIGQGSSCIELLSALHLPTLSQFRLEKINIFSPETIITFLNNHHDSLRNIVFRGVSITCSFENGLENETLPQEWQSIFTTIQALPSLTALAFADLGYHDATGTSIYRLWIHRTQICGSRSPIHYGTDSGEAYHAEEVINAQEVLSRARGAVNRAIEAVLNSTGMKVLTYSIPSCG